MTTPDGKSRNKKKVTLISKPETVGNREFCLVMKLMQIIDDLSCLVRTPLLPFNADASHLPCRQTRIGLLRIDMFSPPAFAMDSPIAPDGFVIGIHGNRDRACQHATPLPLCPLDSETENKRRRQKNILRACRENTRIECQKKKSRLMVKEHY